MEEQTKKQVDALKSLNLLNITDELKPIQGIFSKILLNDWVIDKLKEIEKLQDIIKTDELYYKSRHGK